MFFQLIANACELPFNLLMLTATEQEGKKYIYHAAARAGFYALAVIPLLLSFVAISFHIAAFTLRTVFALGASYNNLMDDRRLTFGMASYILRPFIKPIFNYIFKPFFDNITNSISFYTPKNDIPKPLSLNELALLALTRTPSNSSISNDDNKEKEEKNNRDDREWSEDLLQDNSNNFKHLPVSNNDDLTREEDPPTYGIAMALSSVSGFLENACSSLSSLKSLLFNSARPINPL